MDWGEIPSDGTFWGGSKEQSFGLGFGERTALTKSRGAEVLQLEGAARAREVSDMSEDLSPMARPQQALCPLLRSWAFILSAVGETMVHLKQVTDIVSSVCVFLNLDFTILFLKRKNSVYYKNNSSNASKYKKTVWNIR